MRRPKSISIAWALVASFLGVTVGFVAVADTDVSNGRWENYVETGEAPLDGPQESLAVLVTTDLTEITPSDMVTGLLYTVLPEGVTVENAKFNGRTSPGAGDAPHAGGKYVGGTVAIGIRSGVTLSTGDIANVRGGEEVGATNTSSGLETSVVNRTPGDQDLADLLKVPVSEILDAAYLEFDITSSVLRTINFNFVFGSEEYNEWVGWRQNDVFGLFVTNHSTERTTQHAWVPGPRPVAKNNVNCGNPYDPPLGGWNCLRYANNECGTGGLAPYPCAPPNRETELDGLTTVGIARVTLLAGTTYTIKLAIADTFDRWGDSDVFIKGYIGGGRVGRGALAVGPGACCTGGVCKDGIEETPCVSGGGTFHEYEVCIDLDPPCDGGTVGACCFFDGECAVTSQLACEDYGGIWGGDADCNTINACCLEYGCAEMTSGCCAAAGGSYVGDDTSCSPTGACYVGDYASCIHTTSACCNGLPNVFAGVGTTCDAYGACCIDGLCFPNVRESNCTGAFRGRGTWCVPDICDGDRDWGGPVPAVSEWGLIVMILLVLAAGTVVIKRDRASTANSTGP